MDGTFYPSNSYGLERKEMPQIDYNKLDDFKEHLANNNVSYTEDLQVNLDLIKPSQKEIDVGKSRKMLETAPKYVLVRPVVLSKDMYLIDGHHRWYANVLGGRQSINAIVVDMNARELLKLASDYNSIKTEQKACVAYFGRFNPPTKAHQAIVKQLSECNIDSFVSTSRSESVDNPLGYEFKHELLNEVFAKAIYCPMSVDNPMNMVEALIEDGYTDITFWAGKDRADHYTEAFVEYTEYTNIIVRELSDIDNISGSDVRASVMNGDYSAYRNSIAEMRDALRYDVYTKLSNILL